MASQYRLSVCPHDTAKNLLGWYTLNTYLQRHLGVGISFDPEENFLVERQKVLDHDYHIVYANPASALCFARDKQFVPVARPAGIADEVVVVARLGSAPGDRPRVASATDQLVVHGLGLRVLKSLDVDPGQASFVFTGNHLNAVKAVLQGQADIGFVYNETWNGASALTRAELQVLGASKDGQAFHCFMVAPAWADRRDDVGRILCEMHLDAGGQRVLADLQFTALEPVGMEAIDRLGELMGG
jgi:phosphonate transport system substrate-binding protein